ncbi:PspC domain-containing protein [Cellulomonas phragmiteti]|uniref:Phage shock protein PspC N-terminal domain-containing protein n=1 Tax=Cellulomonas phragmiteti TaxID=478780 RepID=A0ABQ4DIC3_9CELL|nr:PspC domain-containing protein [Cellulomonas phragmiteti]GIG39086.1 hypothetical protein Cph01nite_08480 [Cellulomonas phragmiteti]
MDTQTPAGPDAGTPGTTPGPGPGPHPGTTPPPAPHAFWAGVRRTGLYRSDERWVGGVAGGLAARVGVDPLIVRGLLAVTFLVGGLGLVLYGVAWALLPDARDNRILLERLGAGDADGALLGSLAFVVVGLARGDGWWWFWDGGGALGGVLWLACVVGVVALVVTAVQRRQPGTWQAPAWSPGAPGAGATPGSAPTAGAAAAPVTWASTATAAMPVPPAPPVPPVPGGPPAPPYPPYPPYASYGSAPVPPAPPVPPRPPRRSADAVTVGTVIGLSVVTLGVLLLAERVGAFSGPVGLTAGGVALALAGLGIVTLGLRGRSSGFVGFLAVAGALVWVPTALVHQTDWSDTVRGWEGQARDVTVTSREDARSGFDLGAGTSRIDLTGVPLDDSVLRVPISIGAGQLTVVVPQEAAVRANVTAGIGSVRFESDDDVQEQSGVGLGDLTYEDDAAAAGSPNLVLDISSGVGEVRIIEEAAS